MSILLSAFVAFIITLSAMPITIKIAKKLNLLDNPSLRPHPAHVQTRIVPRAGGLACFIGFLISMLIFNPLENYIYAIILALIILLIIGLLDDKYQNFSPYLRLVGQFVAAITVVAAGVTIQFITNPMGGIINFENIFLPVNFLNLSHNFYISDILAIIWIVWVMNMINWSKGVDGQMPSITTSASLILGFLSLKLFFLGDPLQERVAQLAFQTTGVSLALLIFNWHPAKIFPGFSGSTILGFMIAVLAMLSGAKLATATLVLLIPATDFLYIFTRRILQGKSPVWADKGHLHHKLLEVGFSHQQISLFYFLSSVILGSIALSLSSGGKLFAIILVATILLGGIIWLNFFGRFLKHPVQDNG